MRYPVIGELLNAGAVIRSVTTPPTYSADARTGASGASGASCTESVTVPQTRRSGSLDASATWYCSEVSPGSALSATVTVSWLRSALGTTEIPAGRPPPSSPRMSTTLSGFPGNGLVVSSLASTLTTVDLPRFTIALSGAGEASGRLDATTFNSMRPGWPTLRSSSTPSVTPVVAPFLASALARSVRVLSLSE